jgi:TetR/AcrR family transcriptional regulator
LSDKSRVNFDISRRLLTRGMALGMIKKINEYEMADVIWALIVGIIQFEDAKSDDRKGHKLKESALRFAEGLIAQAPTNKKPPTQNGIS